MGFSPGIITRVSQTRLPTKSEAVDLQLPQGAKVLHLERAITANGEVVAFSYDTLSAEGMDKRDLKKFSEGSFFAALDSMSKQPSRARAEIHAISSKEIGWGKGKPRSGLYLLLRQVHYLRDGTPIATGETYFVEGKFQFIIHRTL